MGARDEVVRQHRYVRPPRVNEVVGVSVAFAVVVAKMLEKRPSDRFASWADVRRAARLIEEASKLRAASWLETNVAAASVAAWDEEEVDRGSLESIAQTVRIVEVGLANAHATLGEVIDLGRIADAYADQPRIHALKKALDDGAPKLTGASRDNEHDEVSSEGNGKTQYGIVLDTAKGKTGQVVAEVGGRLLAARGIATSEPDRVSLVTKLARDLAAESLVRASDQRSLPSSARVTGTRTASARVNVRPVDRSPGRAAVRRFALSSILQGWFVLA